MGAYVGILRDTTRHNPSSISVHGPHGPWDPLRSPAESVRKAKVAPEVRAIQGGEKPTDLLGKED